MPYSNISNSALALSLLLRENSDTPIVQLPGSREQVADVNRSHYLLRSDEQSVADLIRDSKSQFMHAMLSTEPFKLQGRRREYHRRWALVARPSSD